MQTQTKIRASEIGKRFRCVVDIEGSVNDGLATIRLGIKDRNYHFACNEDMIDFYLNGILNLYIGMN